MALRAAFSAAVWAANGVLLRDPLNPALPALALLPLLLAAGFLPWNRRLGGFGHGLRSRLLRRRGGGRRRGGRLFLHHHAPARALARPRVGVRALAPDRQGAPVPGTGVG